LMVTDVATEGHYRYRWIAVYGICLPSGILLMSSSLRADDNWAIRALFTISIEAPWGLVPKPVIGAVVNTMSLLCRPLIQSANECMSATEEALSTVRLRVLASTSLARRTGLVKVRPLSDWRVNASQEG
jgi:hypothetical protein